MTSFYQMFLKIISVPFFVVVFFAKHLEPDLLLILDVLFPEYSVDADLTP